MAIPVGSPTQCAVSHAPGHVPGEHDGNIRLYRSLQSTAMWWLCDADAESAPSRGVHIALADQSEHT
jgi:hypothetical protein